LFGSLLKLTVVVQYIPKIDPSGEQLGLKFQRPAIVCGGIRVALVFLQTVREPVELLWSY
jgi:hypothetical protein